MKPRIGPASADVIRPLRTRHRAEMNCQIVHDSIHRRDGWTTSYLIELNGNPAGFGSVALAGPWRDKPTIFEFFLLPEHRTRAFELFEMFLAVSGARYFEVQSNDALLTAVLHTYGRDTTSEKIVFHDHSSTALVCPGGALRCVTPAEEIHAAMVARQGGGEWHLELQGDVVAKGGILFHYNQPYGDLYMQVEESFRQRGLGSYLVQELKRACYALGALPGARCSPTNIASRRTLQRAGMVPFAHILNASIASTP